MAAFDETSGPDLEVYGGQAWSAWQLATESEGVSGDELGAARQNKEVARLKRKDLGLFGYCPAKDNFYVVLCEHCHLPFKPQAFHYHMEKRHKKKSPNTPLASFIASSAVRSPDVSETVSNSLSSVDHLTPKKPDKASLSHAIKQALQKVGSPPCGSISSSSMRSSSTSSKYRIDSISGKKSPFHASPASLSDSKSNKSTKFTFPVKETNKADKRTMKYDHSSKHAKVHKHDFVLQTKPHKVKSENIKKINEGGNSHHRHHCSTFSSSKVATKAQLLNQSSVSVRSKATYDDILEKNQHRTGPIVVLEKSPALEKTSLGPIHVKVRRTGNEKGNASNLDPRAKATTPNLSHKNKRNHNSELEISKSGDRSGVTKATAVGKLCDSKLKKTRKYDPNKHCGVLITEGTPCTRSLTCKTHGRNFKRRVSGRAKPFDELLADFTNSSRQLSDQTMMQTSSNPSQGTDSGTPRSTNGRVPLPSTTPPLPVRSISELSTPVISQNKPLSNAGKVSLQSSSKPKNSIHLFPHATVARHVDCWNDTFIDGFEENVDAEQLVLNRHPSPILVQQYGSRAMGGRHTVYNRKTDFQWKSVLPMFKKSDLKNTRKPSFLSLSDAFKTNFIFNPLPSVSRSFLTCLKNAKIASERQKQQCLNKPECNTVFVGKKLADSYASNLFPKKTLLQRQVRCQKHQSKSLSIDENSLSTRTSVLVHGRPQRNERHTIDSLPGPPSPKSQRCSVPLEQRMVLDETLKTPTSLHGKFVQLSTTSSNLDASSNTQSFNLNSYLVQEQSVSSLQSESGSGISSGPSSKLPNSLLQYKSSNIKQLIMGRKNSMKHQSSTSQPGKAQESHSIVATSVADGNNHEVPLLNGLSSGTQPHAWPQSVTLSGSIGALMHTNAVPVEAFAARKLFDLDQQNFSSGGAFIKQSSRNANNSNSVEPRRIDSQTYSSTSPRVNGSVAHADALQSLLHDQHDLNRSTTNGPLVSEATERTTHSDVDPESVEQPTTTVSSYPLSVNQNSDVSEGWTADLLSLLYSGGDIRNNKEAASSHDSTFFLREDSMILSEEKASIAK